MRQRMTMCLLMAACGLLAASVASAQVKSALLLAGLVGAYHLGRRFIVRSGSDD